MAVNLSPIGGAAAQFLDNSGNPLSGGKIYTYAAGTTTPQATYTSSSGGTAHSNPIILDAAGRVPTGEIWLTDGLPYKFIIKTSTDVQIGSYDNIIGVNSIDAEQVSYTPPFTGSVATNVKTKLAQTISVKDFGAVCNGVADDATAIQAAINYANSIGGATVLADGNCIIGTAVSVSANVKFLFNILKPLTSSTNVLTIYGGTVVQGKVDTSAFPTYSGNAVTIDGNGENVGSPFRLHIQTDVDVVVNGGGSTGTAVYFKATDTIARIMNVKLQADINKFQYGVRMEQTSTDLSKFITSNTITINSSDTLIALSMASSQANSYGLDGNNISAKSQPKGNTTNTIFDICGQDNIFDLLPWDWNTVSGTAPIAVNIQPFSRQNIITLRANWTYLNNLSTDSSNIFMALINSGLRVPSLYATRTDNILPVVNSSLRLDNNKYFIAKSSAGADCTIFGLTTSDNLLLQAAPVAGSNILLDTRNATGIYAFKTNGTNTFYVSPTNIAPGSDNALSNGTSGARWSVVYAATGAINTSDARAKQDVSELDAAEKRVAIALKRLIRKFRFKDAVEKKGEEARIHTGIIAQEVETAFSKEGLDARRYGLLCYDKTDDNDIYGVRYDELTMFILGAL